MVRRTGGASTMAHAVPNGAPLINTLHTSQNQVRTSVVPVEHVDRLI